MCVCVCVWEINRDAVDGGLELAVQTRTVWGLWASVVDRSKIRAIHHNQTPHNHTHTHRELNKVTSKREFFANTHSLWRRCPPRWWWAAERGRCPQPGPMLACREVTNAHKHRHMQCSHYNYKRLYIVCNNKDYLEPSSRELKGGGADI